MKDRGFFFFPLALPILLALILLALAVFLLIEIDVIAYAYGRIGIHHHYVFFVLFLSLVGSYINIPVVTLPARRIVSCGEETSYNMPNIISWIEDWSLTVVALNVGGALVPTLLSVYLLVQNNLYGTGLIAVALVTAIVHRLAHVVEGVGIVIPMFLPPIVAAAIALLLSRHHAPALAYIAGCLGTLIGGDLLNLSKLRGLGAPVVSIGGAGTFDGVFLVGILAVLLA